MKTQGILCLLILVSTIAAGSSHRISSKLQNRASKTKEFGVFKSFLDCEQFMPKTPSSSADKFFSCTEKYIFPTLKKEKKGFLDQLLTIPFEITAIDFCSPQEKEGSELVMDHEKNMLCFSILESERTRRGFVFFKSKDSKLYISSISVF